jgi:hypothetical protein
MGIIASFALERKVNGKWKNLGDLFSPTTHTVTGRKRKDVFRTSVDYRTYGHNGLFWAHLLGACTCGSFSDVSDDLGDKLRIWGNGRGIPADADNRVLKAIGDRSHMGPDATPSYCTLQEILAFDWTQSITHRFWVNGPITLKWSADYDRPPAEYQTWSSAAGGKPLCDRDALVVPLAELEKLVRDSRYGFGSNADRERRVAAWAAHRWACVERRYPLLDAAHDFLGKIAGQLLDGTTSPEHSRIICWVS